MNFVLIFIHFSELYRYAEPNETLTFAYHDCGKSIALNKINRQFSPYLYPFIIEHCILYVGVWFNMYSNINNCPNKNILIEKHEHQRNGETGNVVHDFNFFEVV